MITAMMNKRWRLSRNQKGMTLIELMAVVVILGIVAAVAGVAVTKGFDSSKTNTDAASIKIITDAVQRYNMDGNAALAATSNLGTSGVELTKLVTAGYLSTVPKVQDQNSAKTAYFNIVTDATSKLVTVTIVKP